MLWAWWGALHALLAAAAALVGAPAELKWLAIAALASHAAVRRPSAVPEAIIFAADGACAVPEWGVGGRTLGARTRLCPLWVELDLGTGPWPRHLLLVVDQVDARDWRRLRALLSRSRCD